jgi:FixJ family two-component response regulator
MDIRPVHVASAELKRVMVTSETIVFVIDDDPSFRRSSEMLIESAGLSAQAFSSAEEFLRSRRPDAPACLVLDVRLPHLSGLDLQRELTKAGVQIPIIFMTGHGDVPMTVQAMRAGAIEFLTKPFREQDLLDPYTGQSISTALPACSGQSSKTCGGVIILLRLASVK